ncbi:MAG: Alanine--tRNA ligase [candidate division WS2 bacterium]|uniref:Alanine--tRNA ligase n=1 Tax=Psychracetigena formicireducens TaxID=2986056 RepID=A0A9E2F0Q3_PSYF1|nr:Alanine--tRNA ligase [Candidatus Psychracetigena formicireducens]MBT9144629.1 Alanine--tRNA ligase [Candidatus Psychracetigena formicireducens]MBT9149881.1 Alanine--tRNA ligase [Candidatus Psychracetigena formicireducens]
MLSSTIRESFINYFLSQGHMKLPGSSLVPSDPSLLFTIAGMVQFKPYFLEELSPPSKRVATVQTCLRVNDIDQIGYSSRHVTLLEMLGNFSFGDYFKEEAIHFAWEFVLDYLKLPREKLLVTVYEQDEESLLLWQKVAGLSTDKIISLGEEDNFWRMGETGPCGPASEIYYDRGEGPFSLNDFPGDRFVEFWNLVFIQYNAQDSGILIPLPKKNIDTGMGLERMSAIMQKKDSVFETDVFQPIINTLSQMLNAQYKESNIVTLRIIADHLRSITFLLSEGLTPSNEWRGYVLRRLIRRSFLKGYRLGTTKPFLYKVVPEIVSLMGEFYPTLKDKPGWVAEGVKAEEEKFLKTLGRGLDYFAEHLDKLKSEKITIFSGKDAFFLYDTYGFPLELQTELLQEENFTLDTESFNEEMSKQRSFSKFQGKEETEKTGIALYEEFPATEFIGYSSLEAEATVLMCEKREDGNLTCLFDVTPFYGFGGGELPDFGLVKNPEGVGQIIDVYSTDTGRIVHIVQLEKEFIRKGERVILEVDASRRKDMEIHHTCTHLLQAALRKLLGSQVTQAGSSVSPDYFRFDYTYHNQLTSKEIISIESLVNEYIRNDYEVNYCTRTYKEALDMGATALFGEKYGEEVRIVKINNISTELCGGTHLKRTGEAGLFLILKEEGVGAGLRRIEAVSGKKALDYLNRLRQERETSLGLIKQSGDLVQGINNFLNDYKQLQQQKEILVNHLITICKGRLLANTQSYDNLQIISSVIDHLDQKSIRILADELRNSLKEYIIVLVGKESGYLFVSLSESAIKKGLHAGKIAGEIAQRAEGKGGGNIESGQGGVKDIDKACLVLNDMVSLISIFLK